MLLALEIDFTHNGNSNRYVGEGWSHPEDTHRWTMGAEAHLHLPSGALQAGAILVLCATPCRHQPALASQMVMVALDGRLLANVRFDGLHVQAWRLPALLAAGDVTLSLLHLNHAAPRGPGQMRGGLALGLMVHSLRVFHPLGRGVPELGGRAVPGRTLMENFESIGQGCHFGLIQRQAGAEKPGLLRFVDTTTAALYEGLCAGFAGLEAPGRLGLEQTDKAHPTWRWRQADYDLRFDTWVPVAGTDTGALLARQGRRLGFLRRKFFEDVRLAEKVFVLTRTDCLTQAEALAVFCALSLHGPAVLLWTVFGDAAQAGQVERVMPGFLLGHLGEVDDERYAPLAVWRLVLAAAWAMAGG